MNTSLGYRFKKFINRENIYLLIIPFVIFYSELMLKAFSLQRFSASNLLGAFFGSLALGFICDLFCSISRRKLFNNWLAFIFIEISCAACMVEYFLNDTFNTYMGISSIINGTEGVVGEFSDVIRTVAINGAAKILVFELPAIIYLLIIIFNKTKLFAFRRRSSLVVHSALMFIIISAILSIVFLFANPTTKAKLTNQYTFDSAVKGTTLQMSVAVDVYYLIFDNPFKTTIIVPEDETPEETQTDTEEETMPEKYGQNIMEIDFDRLSKESDNPVISEIHSYVNSLKASSKNKYTGKFKGKNLIMITAEAFSKEVIDPERTPTLYRLANNGIVFEDYYQPYWYGSTATGEMSYMTGIIPTDGITSYYQCELVDLPFTMAHELGNKNYKTIAFHDGYYDYYSRNTILPHMGYSEFYALGQGLENVDETWPESDLQMMQSTVSMYTDDEPFCAYYMSISGHCNYTQEGNFFARKYKDADFLKDSKYSEIVNGYLSGNQELEYALEYLVKCLEDVGIADDTVIVITADHYPYGLTDSAAWGTDKNYLAELYGFTPETHPETDHNACIIWCGEMEDEHEEIVVSEPAYSIDILPTLLNLFGVEYDSRLLPGRDVFSDAEALVIWPDYSWLTSKGYYDSQTDVFTPNEGVEISDSYVTRIKAQVANKINYCSVVLEYNYFNLLFERN